MKASDSPFFLATALKWYKRRDVQQAIADACQGREVAARYGEGFGRRPDQILYPADVLSFASNKATSFHCSEERWRHVSQVKTGASRKEQDALRTGWDLVLDIDCPYWFFAKLTAKLFVEALRRHGVTSVTVKFSGSKGFHIGVPFEAFPEQFGEKELRELFPEAPRAIASYLLGYIATTPELVTIKKNTIVFSNEYRISFEKLTEVTGKQSDEFIVERCRSCSAPRAEAQQVKQLFLCTSCGHTRRQDRYADFLVCERCNGAMEPQKAAQAGVCTTPSCGGTTFEPRFAVDALIEVDTVLLASRHLFRAPYSLHEKSGLASIVIPPSTIMEFEKEMATPGSIKTFSPFLSPPATRGEAAELLAKSLDHATQTGPKERKEFAIPEEAIPEELFPPCMRNILAGLTDGRKRAMFALTNFLRTAGWGHDQIAARLEEWNKANPEQLREVTIKGHMRTVKQKREAIPPPNCKSFYLDIGVCTPDTFCARIKNPAQYARLQFEARQEGGKKRERTKLTEEQKAARRAHRERKKQAKQRTAGTPDPQPEDSK